MSLSSQNSWILPWPVAQPGRLLAYLSMWTVFAVVATTTTFIAMGNYTVGEWLFTFYHMLAYFYVWGILALAISRIVWRVHARYQNNLIIVCMHLSILVLVSILLVFLLHYPRWPAWLYGGPAIGFHTLNAFMYSFVLVGSQLLKHYEDGQRQMREAKDAELRSAQLEKDLSEARVAALTTQMNPHFLFNTLNSITSLIETSNNAEAIRMTGRLGSLLRNALEQSSKNFVRLEEELEFLQMYVEIEKIRFGDRFVFEQVVPKSSLAHKVPSLFLQPIVENAVKHAVSQSSSSVVVTLRVTPKIDRLIFDVADDGPGLEGRPEFGHGLKNVSERLLLLYGENSDFTIQNNADGGVSVVLALPMVIAQAQPDVTQQKHDVREGDNRRGAMHLAH